MASPSGGGTPQQAMLASNRVFHESGSFELLDFNTDRDKANECLAALSAFQAQRAASPKKAAFDPHAAVPLFLKDESTAMKVTGVLIAALLAYLFNVMGRS